MVLFELTIQPAPKMDYVTLLSAPGCPSALSPQQQQKPMDETANLQASAVDLNKDIRTASGLHTLFKCSFKELRNSSYMRLRPTALW